MQQRIRNCDNPRQEGMGDDCAGSGEELTPCNVDACTEGMLKYLCYRRRITNCHYYFIDINGMWGPWGESACSETSCEGVLNKARACNSPPPANNGSDCDSSIMGSTDLNVTCNTHLGIICPGELITHFKETLILRKVLNVYL